MADPVSLAMVATAATVVGTGVSVYGNLQKGKADQAAQNAKALEYVDKSEQYVAQSKQYLAQGEQYEGKALGFEAQSRVSKYQAGIAGINRAIAKQNEDYARIAGESAAQKSGLQTKAVLGTTKAIQGASGVSVDSGSSTDVRESEAKLGAFDQATIRANAAKTAYGFEVEQTTDTAQEQVYRMASEGYTQAADYARKGKGALVMAAGDSLVSASHASTAAGNAVQAGKYAKQAGDIGAAASLLGGASSVSSKWLDASRTGIGSSGYTTSQPDSPMASLYTGDSTLPGFGSYLGA